MSIIRTKLAEDDIKGIYLYSYGEFGEEQAEKYYNELEERFQQILDQTAHSQDYSHIDSGLRRVNYERHAIYYELGAEGEIMIIRVLHQQMDEVRHLGISR